MAALIKVLSIIMLFFAWMPAHAQVQRSFINLSFEQPSLNPNATDCPTAGWPFSTVMPHGDIPGWRSTHKPMAAWCTNNGGTTGFQSPIGIAPLIDIWKSGKVAGILSRDGKQHAELNALEASMIYQTVCLINNDSIRWRFSHRARGDVSSRGPGIDEMEFGIFDIDENPVIKIVNARTGTMGTGNAVCSTDPGVTCAAPVSAEIPDDAALQVPFIVQPTFWMDYSGTMQWSGGHSNNIFGFRAIANGTNPLALDQGNLIDAIQLEGLKPFVELSKSAYSSQEGEVDGTAVLISGLVEGAPLLVQIEVTAGTATAGSDYTSPQIINLNIPVDVLGYTSKEFKFDDQIQILVDNLEEAPETFTLKIVSSANYLIESTQTCGGVANATANYTILDAHMSVTKTVTHADLNSNSLKDTDDRLDYTVTVKNTGSVPLTNVSVNDPLLGGLLSPASATLAPNAQQNFTGQYIVKNTDMANGKVSNSATATATDPLGNSLTKSAQVETTLDIVRSMDFIKSVGTPNHVDTNNNGLIDVGETIQFGFTLTNTGNVDANITSVVDALPGFTFSGLTLPRLLTTTVAGKSVNFTGSYTVTQADIDTGTISNSATAHYTALQQNLTVQSHAPGGGAQTIINIPESTGSNILSLTKIIPNVDLGPDDEASVGDKITYLISVKNNGNTTINNIAVVDPLVAVNTTIPQLASGATHNLPTIVYSITQTDIDKGFVTNSASATGTSTRGTKFLATTPPLTHYFAAEPSVDLLKEARFVNLVGSELPEIGDRIDYKFTATNTGNVTIDTFVITDDFATVVRVKSPTPLAPGEQDSSSFTASHIITASDLERGSITNVAELNGMTTGGMPVNAMSHGPNGQDTTIRLTQKAAVKAEMTGKWIDGNGNGIADAGEIVEYQIILTNTGNVSISNLQVIGTIPGGQQKEGAYLLKLLLSQTVPVLKAFDQPYKFTFNHTLTQADIDGGEFLSAQIKVTGNGPLSLPQNERLVADLSDDPAATENKDLNGDGIPDDPTLVKLPQLTKLGVTKTGIFLDDGIARQGSQIEYSVMITNLGNLTISGVEPVDSGPLFGGKKGAGLLTRFQPGPVTLKPGETSPVFKALYTITAADVKNALMGDVSVVNEASAKGNVSSGKAIDVVKGEARLKLPSIYINKATPIPEVMRGNHVDYVIIAESFAGGAPIKVRLLDHMPQGFTYVPDTATLNGQSFEPEEEDGQLIFDEMDLTIGEPALIKLKLAVSASVKLGDYTNRATLLDAESLQPVTLESAATVSIISEPLFDCGEILGKVFNDRNGNGYQDEGEEGIAGARVTSVSGIAIQTDAQGRFSIVCPDMPDPRLGSNFILKLDPRSLPTGYRIISENPRTIRLTSGKASEVSFAASIGRVVRLDIKDGAFLPAQTKLNPVFEDQLNSLVKILEAEPTVLRIYYGTEGEDRSLVRQRIRSVRLMIAELWRQKTNRYRLDFETRVDMSVMNADW